MGAVRDEAVDRGHRVTRRQRDKMNAAVVEQYVRADQESPTGSRAKLATAVSITRLVLAARTSTCWPMDAAAARVCVIRARMRNNGVRNGSGSRGGGLVLRLSAKPGFHAPSLPLLPVYTFQTQ